VNQSHSGVEFVRFCTRIRGRVLSKKRLFVIFEKEVIVISLIKMHSYYNTNDFINITVSVPRGGSFNSSSHQVVPDNDFVNSDYSDEGIVPSPNQLKKVETESFYDDFFGCVKKTPDGARFTGYDTNSNSTTHKYHISSTGELRKLKERALTRDLPATPGLNGSSCTKRLAGGRSPWRLIIEEEDLITSSPVFPKPQASKGLKKRDPDGFRRMLQNAGWKVGILPG